MAKTARAKVQREARNRGYQSSYTKEVADLICERLAEGESLNSICKPHHMPGESAVRYWALSNRDGFAAKYTQAREIGYDRMAEDVLKLADTPRKSKKITDKADGTREIVTSDAVDRARLQVDTRKWLLSKVLPKIYGDRAPPGANININIGGPQGIAAKRVLLASLDDLAAGAHLIEGTAEEVPFGE